MNERPAKDDAGESASTEAADAAALPPGNAEIERLTEQLAAERQSNAELIRAIQALAAVVERAGATPGKAAAAADEVKTGTEAAAKPGSTRGDARAATPPSEIPAPVRTSPAVRGGKPHASTRGSGAKGTEHGAADDSSERAERKRARSEQRAERSAARRSAQRHSTRGAQHAGTAGPSDEDAGPKDAAAVAPPAEIETSSGAGAGVDLNVATFEQLRQVGMSVTQATRVIAYRDRRDGFGSVDDLDKLPGFPKGSLTEMKQRLTV